MPGTQWELSVQLRMGLLLNIHFDIHSSAEMELSHSFWSHSHNRKSLQLEGTWTDSFGSNHG